MPTLIALVAPAKLTLTLRVTGIRDDGYHLIDAEMVSLDLFDSLEVQPTDGPSSLEIIGDAAGAGLAAGTGLAAEPDNLVVQALKLAGRDAHVRLTKQIPPGGGLGGGSSDAAAILRWAGYTDLAGAARLGADVPFCVVGGRARVRGIGEQVDALPFIARTLTLVTPPFGCSTPAVYQAWDELGGPVGENGNDLEPAALRVEPRLAAVRDALGRATGEVPRLAGSGSTWFVEGAFPGEGRVVAQTIEPTT